MGYVQDININTTKKRTNEELKKASELCEKVRKENSKLVKGIFKNVEVPGGDLEFAFREHKGDPIRKYHLQDGETYEIPLNVAKHINNNTKVPIHTNLIDPKTGKNITRPGSYRERYQFVSTEFM